MNIFKKATSFQIIIFGFAVMVLAGCFLLMLPWAKAGAGHASFGDALFTATSAVCVTGLVVQDTATYWSGFGQGVILVLIQIGGLGVVSAATAITILTGKKINLRQRSAVQEALSAPQVGGVVKLTGFILKLTFLFELLGMILLAPVFCRDFGIAKGIWYSLFHSVSAFCNAGFDLMGVNEKFSSLTCYSGNFLINFVIMGLIFAGGLGFLTWEDIRIHKHHFKKYRMQSKVIITTTLLLIIIPAVYFYFCEFTSDRWDMKIHERILGSLFQSVTPRTAGFNTVDLTALRQGSLAVIIILMLIGGSPGSTAGGMKTTTIAVLFSSAISVFGRKEETHFFGRRIAQEVIIRAAAILLMYAGLAVTGGIVISLVDDVPLTNCLFETSSAIGTVGLSDGLTQQLGAVSKSILIILMFVGRAGGLTFIFAALSMNSVSTKKLPLEKINVG